MSIKNNYKQQSADVALYYDQWQNGYNDIYGCAIQAFRPSNTVDLFKYISQSACLHNGLNVLDAGCGVAGPAIWLSKNFEIHIVGVTISDIQVQQAKDTIKKENLDGRIKIFKADFHELDNLFSPNTFDLVLFLESLGHSGDPARVIRAAYHVLKPGGSIYIKDFYYKETENPFWQNRIMTAVRNVSKLYKYNTLNLSSTVSALRVAGFGIDFIRKFAFVDDATVRYNFERSFNIDVFGGEPEFHFAEWLEIRCIKPFE